MQAGPSPSPSQIESMHFFGPGVQFCYPLGSTSHGFLYEGALRNTSSQTVHVVDAQPIDPDPNIRTSSYLLPLTGNQDPMVAYPFSKSFLASKAWRLRVPLPAHYAVPPNADYRIAILVTLAPGATAGALTPIRVSYEDNEGSKSVSNENLYAQLVAGNCSDASLVPGSASNS